MSRILSTYRLRHAIVRETARPGASETNEEELKPAGFEVVLKRPRAKDMTIMDAFQGREVAGSIALIARISNLDEEEASLLDGEDMGELGNLLGSAAPAGQTTGVTA